MSKHFFAFDWYWLADDGRLYGSARQAVVSIADPAYQVWAADGAVPTRWPADEIGAQTNDALQAVLAPYGLFVSLLEYAADARWRREVGGAASSRGPIATNDRSKMLIMGSLLAAQADPKWTTVWQFADGTAKPITAADMQAISTAAQAHVNACFTAYATLAADIASASPKTKSRADVDAAFASIA